MIIHFLDDAFFHDLLVAVRGEEAFNKSIPIPRAGIEEVEIFAWIVGVHQTSILQDGDRKRTAHGGRLSIDPHVIEILGDIKGIEFSIG